MGEGRYKNQPAVLRRYQGKGVLQPLPVPEPCPQPNTACRDGYRARKDNAVSAAILPLAALVERDRLLAHLLFAQSMR